MVFIGEGPHGVARERPRAWPAQPARWCRRFDDRIEYSFDVSRDGRSTRPAFQYTNANTGRSGGTFRLARLGSVQCTGTDTVTFSAFGAWSKDDPAALPRLATVQVSTAPAAPYVTITVYQQPDAIDNVVLSNANTKPAEKPLP